MTCRKRWRPGSSSSCRRAGRPSSSQGLVSSSLGLEAIILNQVGTFMMRPSSSTGLGSSSWPPFCNTHAPLKRTPLSCFVKVFLPPFSYKDCSLLFVCVWWILAVGDAWDITRESERMLSRSENSSFPVLHSYQVQYTVDSIHTRYKLYTVIRLYSVQYTQYTI